jgi:putative transposase
MIDQLRHQHPVTKLCDLLNVAKSGHQAWSTGKVVPLRKLEDMRLLVVIRAAHQRGRGMGILAHRDQPFWRIVTAHSVLS